MRIYVSPLGSPRKQEVWGRRGAFVGRNMGRRRRERKGVKLQKASDTCCRWPRPLHRCFCSLPLSQFPLTLIHSLCLWWYAPSTDIKVTLSVKTSNWGPRPSAPIISVPRSQTGVEYLICPLQEDQQSDVCGGCEDSDVWGGGLKMAQFTALQSDYKESSHGC